MGIWSLAKSEVSEVKQWVGGYPSFLEDTSDFAPMTCIYIQISVYVFQNTAPAQFFLPLHRKLFLPRCHPLRGPIILQSLTLADDTKVVKVVSGILNAHGIEPELLFLAHGVLRSCDGNASHDMHRHLSDAVADGSDAWESLSFSPVLAEISNQTFGIRTVLTDRCAPSMGWTLDVIAALPNHFMNTAWASFNVYAHIRMRREYEQVIVAGGCDGVDALGGWWNGRLRHAVPILVLNAIVLLALSFRTWRLFLIYRRQSFSSVEAPSNITRIHKYLCFVMTLRLSSSFTIAATALWIGKLTEDAIREATNHYTLYLAGFITSVVVNVLWIVFVRYMQAHSLQSYAEEMMFFLLCWVARPTASCFSPGLFFATMTVVTYVFLVATSILGIVCRFNFGEGLAHYLMLLESLANDNFTPASFAHDPEETEWPTKVTDIPRFSVVSGETFTITPIGGVSSPQYGQPKERASFLCMDPKKH
ncbi:hypothetical protein EW146_g7964 [Bondarzewia mesenterica]|uniref:Uncharacterized protein n=1 Tax=Bondarzewia mesenterica TaxID=1095465 RepID=A0A4S4LIQ5_9AGAM|nr:hypothetical protein EW146_g7964 [Bondarzewia mesenterica]